MRLYSTNNQNSFVSLKTAVMKGLPDDNGLFMPESIPYLGDSFFNNLNNLSFQEIAFTVSKNLFQGIIPLNDLENIIYNSINFSAPVFELDKTKYVLELFHGPSLAFKDFGARFMAQLMEYFNKKEKKELIILVATSGDTGGAVASGFYKKEGIKVVILYPSKKVSFLQEQQLTTLGHNVTALEVDGTFDDCQALVKKAFLDKELNSKLKLSSANSINIARLIPQSFYYFEAYKQLPKNNQPVVFSIPSGNFGNLTAGLFAKKMGLPIKYFLAATNINDVIPKYLKTGIFSPKESVRTISNAMDVGNPSNFARMKNIFNSSFEEMRKDILGFSFDDNATKLAIKEVYEKYHYVIDPHGAVAYLALNTFLKDHKNTVGILLETAHPSKFIDDVENILNTKIAIPKRLAALKNEEKKSILMNTSFKPFKNWLLNTF